MIAIPSDSEKNICPLALASTLIQPVPLNTSKLGLKTNASPSDAPGRVTLLTITMQSITKSAGIAIAENFSIPLDTPTLVIKTVRNTNITVNATV